MRPLLRRDSMGVMAAVFVHGVPETPAVWQGLLAALDRPDTVALSLLGFDSARPAGFGFGHWWMLQDPARAATVLREFWATLA